jgi:hypothetical protein
VGAPVHVTVELLPVGLSPLEKKLNPELGVFFVKVPAPSRLYAVSTVAVEALASVIELLIEPVAVSPMLKLVLPPCVTVTTFGVTVSSSDVKSSAASATAGMASSSPNVIKRSVTLLLSLVLISSYPFLVGPTLLLTWIHPCIHPPRSAI